MKKNKLVKWLFAISLVVLLTANVNAQTFTFAPNDTVLSDTVNSEIIFDFDLTNISSQDITVAVKRTQDERPENWSSSLCFFENCFAPFVDSVSTRISPGETVPFSVHVFTLVDEGTATVTVNAFNQADPSENYTFTLTAHASVTSVDDENLSTSFELLQNYPNPFNPSTTIEFSIPNSQFSTLKVYDVLGREVKTLLNESLESGNHSVNFDASDLGSGVYFYRLTSGGKTISKKMILEK